MPFEIKRVIVFGAGALGSLLGGKLSRVVPVILVGREAHMAEIRASGLRLGGLSNAHAACGDLFSAVSRLDEGFAFRADDAVLLTVKAQDVGAALASLGRVPPGLRVPLFALQNGTGFEDALRAGERQGFQPLHVVAHLGATLRGPGEVEDWGGELLLPAGEASEALAARLQRAGIGARIVENLEAARWKKIVFNCALNALAAILEVPNNETLADAWRPLRRAVLDEGRSLAASHGVELPPAENLLLEFERRASMSRNVNSMWQDLLRGRPTEIEYLNGAVVQQAGSRQVPANERLAVWIRVLERATLPDVRRAALEAAREDLRAFVAAEARA
ncbi:MAG: ketopantoate reductase family protein [Planctomycetota bacterium]|nr:ketopantoate reductase family protein [Planctomycetota bacterium]